MVNEIENLKLINNNLESQIIELNSSKSCSDDIKIMKNNCQNIS